MRKRFNIAGPCIEGEHYLLPPLAPLPRVKDLLENHRYFLVHAPRQCGKTTAFLALRNELNAGVEAAGMYCSLEAAQVCSAPDKGIPQIASLIRRAE